MPIFSSLNVPSVRVASVTPLRPGQVFLPCYLTDVKAGTVVLLLSNPLNESIDLSFAQARLRYFVLNGADPRPI